MDQTQRWPIAPIMLVLATQNPCSDITFNFRETNSPDFVFPNSHVGGWGWGWGRQEHEVTILCNAPYFVCQTFLHG